MLNRIDNAFASGRNQEGFSLLQQYVEEHPEDQSQSYRLAVISEQLGTQEQTTKAYLHSLSIAPNNVLNYLYAGCFWLNVGQADRGLATLSLGQDLDARLTKFQFSNAVSQQTRLRSQQADIALKQHFTLLHQNAVGHQPELIDIYSGVWPQSHMSTVKYLHENQQPHVFYLPSLEAQPFWCEVGEQWQATIDEYISEVRAELLAVSDKISHLGQPYLDGLNLPQAFDKLANSDNWTALHLYKNGEANHDLLASFPATQKLLNKLPLYGLDKLPFEVFFSVLKAGQHIPPHFGLSNHSLTVHLPIIVPGDGYLKVDGVNKAWQEGKLMIFDDSFIHEAVNNSTEDRVVLIFSIWHPSLTEQQQQAIQRSFNTRNAWLANRKQYLS